MRDESRMIARRTARHYAKRLYWLPAIDPEDLEHTAYLAALEAERTWDRRRGPLGPHVGWNCMRTLRAYVYCAQSPMSYTRSEEHMLAGLRGVDLEQAGSIAAAPADVAGWWRRMGDELRAAVDAYDDTGAVAKVLLDGRPCTEVAAEHGMRKGQLRNRLAATRKRLRRDAGVREVYEAMPY